MLIVRELWEKDLITPFIEKQYFFSEAVLKSE